MLPLRKKQKRLRLRRSQRIPFRKKRKRFRLKLRSPQRIRPGKLRRIRKLSLMTRTGRTRSAQKSRKRFRQSRKLWKKLQLKRL